MKDFYDIVMLSRNMDFTGTDVASGIRAAFSLESREKPSSLIISVNDADVRWKDFLRKTDAEPDLSFLEIKRELEAFINPCLAAMKIGKEPSIVWKKHGAWESVEQIAQNAIDPKLSKRKAGKK